MLNFEFYGKTLIVILGPTATGKTQAAIDLAEKLNTEILSADSRQIYKELKIGSACPSPDQLARVKHHLIGRISVPEEYNAARFESDALKIIDKIFRKQDYVVMVGGSGLYIDALCKGIDELPDPDPALRKRLNEQLRIHGLGSLQQKLLELDRVYYEKVDLKNPKRVIRALEVCLMAGKPYSGMRKNKPKKREFRIEKFGLEIPKETLNERINGRVDSMMEQGLLEEARSLLPFRNANALNTVGYKELFEYFDGKVTREGAIDNIKTDTRRYAKRQMTWFKKDHEITWLKSWLDIPYLQDTFFKKVL